MALNIIDGDQEDAFLMVQMYQVLPTKEPSPIFVLTAADRHWFRHFSDEFNRLWDQGDDWR